MLTTDGQRLFRQLSVFVGGWTLAAAEAVVGGADMEHLDVVACMATLVDGSLVRRGGLGDYYLSTFDETLITV